MTRRISATVIGEVLKRIDTLMAKIGWYLPYLPRQAPREIESYSRFDTVEIKFGKPIRVNTIIDYSRRKKEYNLFVLGKTSHITSIRFSFFLHVPWESVLVWEENPIDMYILSPADAGIYMLAMPQIVETIKHHSYKVIDKNSHPKNKEMFEKTNKRNNRYFGRHT